MPNRRISPAQAVALRNRLADARVSWPQLCRWAGWSSHRDLERLTEKEWRWAMERLAFELFPGVESEYA